MVSKRRMNSRGFCLNSVKHCSEVFSRLLLLSGVSECGIDLASACRIDNQNFDTLRVYMAHYSHLPFIFYS